MEQSPTTSPCSAAYKPVKFCTAFVVLTGLGILLVYGLSQLSAQPVPPPLQSAARTLVRTSSGLVEGQHQTSASGRGFLSFLGLPYAQPPLGPLRFKDPVLPPPQWENTLAATSPREACVVVERVAAAGYVGAEDCLYLNVYTPQVAGAAAVLVWLGDGGLAPRDLAPRSPRVGRLVDQGLVVVTVEHRRGILGFLNGNHGLKDQAAALRWVQDNVAAFGGDPGRVTLWGVGVGAAAVGLHMLSPLSTGLFSRAIAMGGSPLNPWAFNVHPAATVLGEVLFSNYYRNFSRVEDYLRSLSVSELVATVSEACQREPTLTQMLAPSIEPPSPGAFVTDAPWEVLEYNLLNAVPLLTGGTSAEGKHMLKGSSGPALEQLLARLLSPSAGRVSGASAWRAPHLARSFYFGDDTVDTAAAEDVLNLLTDMFYLEGIDRMARSVAALSPYPVYYYHYTRERNDSQDGSGLPGAMHGEDAYAILYGPDDDQGSAAEAEATTDDTWLSMLADFAKTGRPTAISASWPAYTEEDPAYLEVGKQPRVRRGLLPARMDFWRSLLPSPELPQV